MSLFKSWKEMKPLEKKFWKYFWIIKGVMLLIILVLFIIFVMRFKEKFW